MAAVPDGKRYSPFDPDELHKDMREDPATTLRNLANQPAVREKHRDCDVCAELTPKPAPVPSRLGKVQLSLAQVANALHLPPGLRALRMYVTDDPQLLCVLIEGEGLDEIPPHVEAPFLEF